jgi:alkylresorcinol/alkylpyrone synthase
VLVPAGRGLRLTDAETPVGCQDEVVPVIVSAATALPKHRYPQSEITEAFADLMVRRAGVSASVRDVIRRTHEATGVKGRHLVLSLPEYEPLDDFGKANDVFLREAPTLAAEAVRSALDRAGLVATDVDLVASATVTGVAVPSIDARLVGLLELRPDVRRLPLVGLGCVAGASGVARVSELLRGDPDAVAVLVSVELCSLTLQHGDASMANIVASGLFGDGAAAAVMVGERRAAELGLRGPAVIDSRARFFPDTERVMGWDVGPEGLRVVLSADVPALVESELGPVVAELLDRNELTLPDVTRWIAHPGGPKVLVALQHALGIGTTETAMTWRSLREIGNLSSASVLDVLRRVLDEQPQGTGEPALMMAMGPGFCAEVVLIEW